MPGSPAAGGLGQIDAHAARRCATVRAVLRQREFRLLFLSQSVSLLGDGMTRVALAFAVLSVGGSASDVGLVLAASILPMVASLLVGGVVADRTSRRGVMVAADLVRLATQGAMAALLIGGEAEVWSLALLAGAGGAATGFFNPAATGLLPAVVEPEEFQRANGIRAVSMAAGEIAGPILAGVLVAAAGAGWALAVDAASFGVSAAFLTRLQIPKRAGARIAAAPFIVDLREGWREFRARTWVWTFVVSIGLGNMLWGAWSALGPVIADRDLGGAAAWGAVLAAMGAGGVAGALIAIRMRPRRPLVLVALLYPVMALPLAALAGGAALPLLAAAALATGVALMLGNTVWESTLQRHVPGASLSRVSAYDWFGALAFRPVGLALWGPLSVAIGLSKSLWLAFALQIALGLGLLALRSTRRLQEAPEPVATVS
jgi:MFS family permease